MPAFGHGRVSVAGVTVRNRVIPAVVPGFPRDPPARVELPPIRSPHQRRHATAVFDHKGRLTCGMVFDVLDWEAGTPVDIAVRAGVIVVRRADEGGFALNGRRFLHVPARFRRWCSFGERELVLVRAVPESSVLLVLGQEWLDRSLPDPGGLVTGIGPVTAGGSEVGSGGWRSDIRWPNSRRDRGRRD
ncbi:MAG: hypothetical protein HOV94_34205 [Saccharothrix sp.]|nr:hypothetical protein [Saccharothrix sp.]